MDITGHFESASCVIEVDGSATLVQVKGKLLAELGVPRARHVGLRMRGGGDIGNDDLRICDTEMDEGCDVELYYAGASITPGVMPCRHDDAFSLTLSSCDGYLAVVWCDQDMSIFDMGTHERLCSVSCDYSCTPAFSPCSEWISCVNKDTQCVEVRHVKTGALEHSFFGDEVVRNATGWSPCGTKLLSCSNKGLQVWDIATRVLVHEWDHITDCLYVMHVTGDRVAMLATSSHRAITVRDYTTGVEVLVLPRPSNNVIVYSALTPNQRFIAASTESRVCVWDIATGDSVFDDVSDSDWTDVAVSDDVVAAYSARLLCVWSISTGEQLLRREVENNKSNGLALSSCGGVVMYGRDEYVEIVDISDLS